MAENGSWKWTTDKTELKEMVRQFLVAREQLQMPSASDPYGKPADADGR